MPPHFFMAALLLFIRNAAYFISNIWPGVHLMKHLKEYLSHILCNTIPGLAEKIKNMDQETGIKLLQYLMLCVLLYLCFILPKAGIGKKIQESTGRKEIMSEAAEVQSGIGQSDAEKQNGAAGQNDTIENNGAADAGVIVIDAGHGGF